MSVLIEPGSAETKNATVLYESVFESGTVTVSSETSDGAGLNAVEDTTFDFWTGGAATSRITVDYGSDVECDAFGVAAHTIGTDGATIAVEYSDDDMSYTEAASVTPTDDDTIFIVFPVTSARYWRVSVTDGPASIGVMKLGKRLIFPCGVLSGYTPINHAHRIELLTNMSVSGQFLGTRIKRVGADTGIDFGMIETDFVDTHMRGFEDHFNSGRTFFYAGAPDDWPDDYGYCWRSRDEIRPSLDEGGVLSSVSMDVSVYVEA